MIIIYGLKNCDKCRSALKWLDKQPINYQFCDLRKDGLVKEVIQCWVDVIGWDASLNKRSTAGRMLSNEVKDAIANGKHVKRQGEWFFIPTEIDPLSDIAELTEEQKKEYALALAIKNHGRWNNEITEMLGKDLTEKYENISNIPDCNVKRMELRAGKNRPNHAEKGINTGGKSYVKGKVEHSGREHADIVLEGWHIALPNTAIDSFTITGDID